MICRMRAEELKAAEKKRTGLIIGLSALGVLLIILLIVILSVGNKKADSSEPEIPAPIAAARPSAPPAPAVTKEPVNPHGTNPADCNVGDSLFFGAYEQDNNLSNGKEEIEWIVLDKTDDRLLVISKYALDAMPFNTEDTFVTWENCSLRFWLNDDFMNAAFTEKEWNMIPAVTVSAETNPEFNTDPGNATTDRMFLLSIREAEKYFTSEAARRCAPTAYASGAWTYGPYTTESGEEPCWWWLRTPGSDRSYAACVGADGIAGTIGEFVAFGNVGVRPAMWISIN